MGIHNFDHQIALQKNLLRDAKISDKNKKLIADFVNDAILKGLSKPRLIKYFIIMRFVAQKLQKDLDTATVDDLKLIVGEIQQRDDYSPWTKQMYKVIIRCFYRWHAGTKTYPPIVDWISIRISRSETHLPSEGELLTEEDIQLLLNTASHPRDKAIVSMLWESGARISELGNLKIGNVSFDEHGTLISMRGKTGSRKIRLLFSTSYISMWLNCHPFKNNNEAPLWVNRGNTNHYEEMQYPSFRIMLKRLFSKANINKSCHPHLFRHSRATYMASHLTEFQMNQYFGWIQGSKMPSTYVHMSGKELETALFKMNGITVEVNKEKAKLNAVCCSHCGMINSSEFVSCTKCGLSLVAQKEPVIIKDVSQVSNEFLNTLLKDSDFQKLLMEKMKNSNHLEEVYL